MTKKPAPIKTPSKKATNTGKWAVTMAQVRIRQAVSDAPFPRWHLITFCGRGGGESRGVVDLIAIRKDHHSPREGLKRGDALQIILIQAKGGSAASPTAEDGVRLRKVARLHHTHDILLASWKKGKATQFYKLRRKAVEGKSDWLEIEDLKEIFC